MIGFNSRVKFKHFDPDLCEYVQKEGIVLETLSAQYIIEDDSGRIYFVFKRGQDIQEVPSGTGE